MELVVEFIKYFIHAIKDYDWTDQYELVFKEINILPNFYIAFFFIRLNPKE